MAGMRWVTGAIGTVMLLSGFTAALHGEFLVAAWLTLGGLLVLLSALRPRWWTAFDYHVGHQVKMLWGAAIVLAVLGLLYAGGVVQSQQSGQGTAALLLVASSLAAFAAWGAAGHYADYVDRLGRRKNGE